MAEAFLLSDVTFRESWETHREGMLGADLVSARFPAGLILEILQRTGHRLPDAVDEFIAHAETNGFRYYDHPASDPDADTVGAVLRVLKYADSRRELSGTSLLLVALGDPSRTSSSSCHSRDRPVRLRQSRADPVRMGASGRRRSRPRQPENAVPGRTHGAGSGPQSGLSSSPPSVSCTSPLPSAFTIQMFSALPSGVERAKVIHLPSGDQPGE